MGKTILENSSAYIDKQELETKQTGSVPDWWEGIATIACNAITDADNELKDLRHFKDTVCGLYCTDRPDIVKDPIGVLFRIESADELNLINRIDGFCTSSLDPETAEKWDDVKKVLFQNRKALNGSV